MQIVDEVLLESGIDRSRIDALACDVGPGSFTGVRVGVATVKGIAMALDRPLVGVGSLEAMAAAAWAELELDLAVERVVPLIDARKGEVFAACYDRSLQELRPPEHIAKQGVADWLGTEGGAGTRLVGEIASSLKPGSGALVADTPRWPDARWVAERALVAMARGAGTDPGDVVPTYVRAPDAKLPAGAKVS